MPKYVSRQGVWYPANKAAEIELEIKGVETIGHPTTIETIQPPEIVEKPVEEKAVEQEPKGRGPGRPRKTRRA